MNTRKNMLLYSLSLLLLAGMLWSCVEDREDYGSSGEEKGKTVTFSVRVPGSSVPSTYALNAADENEVKTIEVLLFKSGNYYHTVYSNTITTDPGDTRIKTFSVDIPEGTYDMVILANARQSVADVLSGVTTSDPKADVLSRLLLSNSGKWNSDPASGSYIPIPMWGEIASITVNSAMAANNPVALLRMVSKIDVALTTSNATSKFKLESVRLYNYYDKGQIAPDASNWNAGTNVVTAPSVPSSAQKPTNPALTPLIYTGSEITTTDISSIGEIYTFEAEAGNSTDLQNNTCLVIGGTYVGDSQPTYYRVDFANTTGTGSGTTVTYLSLLRNYRYKVNITDVKASGFTNPTDAFNSRPVNISAEIIEWNDSGISDIEFDGQFMLGVSQGKFDFTKSAYTTSSEGNTVSITTDYKSNDGSSQGWKISSIVDGSGNAITDWLTTSVSSGNANVTTDMQLLLTENNSGQERKGYIHISAGRLTYVIEVSQSIVPSLSLALKDAVSGEEISELVFVSQTADIVPPTQQFTASWMPINVECDLSSTGISGNPFSFYTGSDTPGEGAYIQTTASGTGKQTYTIRPAAFTQSEIDNNPLLEKSSKIDFQVSNGMNYKSKTIYLRQVRYGLKPTLNEFYLLNGTQQSFNLKSNSLWKVRSVVDSQGLLSSFDASQNGGYNVQSGDIFLFTLRQVTTAADVGASIVFTFYDPSGKYDDVSVTINPISCGVGGTAAPLKIGNNTYLTHRYGTKCWMVENSREGTASAVNFGGSFTGTTWTNGSTYNPSATNGQHYYGNTYRDTACPSGWHLPTSGDASELYIAVYPYLSAGTQGAKWWGGSAAIGLNSDSDTAALTGGALYYNSGGISYKWNYWSERGYWWINDGTNLKGTASTLVVESGWNTMAFFPVRCVQD